MSLLKVSSVFLAIVLIGCSADDKSETENVFSDSESGSQRPLVTEDDNETDDTHESQQAPVGETENNNESGSEKDSQEVTKPDDNQTDFTPIDHNIFLRGTFVDNWQANFDTQLREVASGKFEHQLEITKGTYQWKIGDSQWSKTNCGWDADTSSQENLIYVLDCNRSGLSNVSTAISQSGMYQLNLEQISKNQVQVTFELLFAFQDNSDPIDIVIEPPLDYWYQQDGEYVVQNQRIEVKLSPEGGRITSAKINGNQLLYTQGDLSGSTFWTSPQSLWGWPSRQAVDNLTYQVDLTDADRLLTMQSVVDSKNYSGESGTPTDFQVSKSFQINSDTAALEITYTITNHSTDAQMVAPWEVTRVPSGTYVFFPSGEDIAIQSSLNLTLIQEDVSWYQQQSDSGVKLFADGEERWLASFDPVDNLLLVKQYQTNITESQFAPDESEIEIYAGNGYVELEQQGEYLELAAGQSTSWKVSWYMAELNDSFELGSDTLVNFVRNITKQ